MKFNEIISEQGILRTLGGGLMRAAGVTPNAARQQQLANAQFKAQLGKFAYQQFIQQEMQSGRLTGRFPFSIQLADPTYNDDVLISAAAFANNLFLQSNLAQEIPNPVTRKTMADFIVNNTPNAVTELKRFFEQVAQKFNDLAKQQVPVDRQAVLNNVVNEINKLQPNERDEIIKLLTRLQGVII